MMLYKKYRVVRHRDSIFQLLLLYFFSTFRFLFFDYLYCFESQVAIREPVFCFCCSFEIIRFKQGERLKSLCVC